VFSRYTPRAIIPAKAKALQFLPFQKHPGTKHCSVFFVAFFLALLAAFFISAFFSFVSAFSSVAFAVFLAV